MIAYFFLGIALLLGILLLLKWFVEADPRQAAKLAGWTLGIVAVIAGLALLWAGRYQLAWIALPAIIAMVSRWRDLRNAWKSMRGPDEDQSSTVETRFLRMTLEHGSGVMSGVVREGRYQGARLEDLSLEDLVDLWREVRAEDAQSATVLEAYMEKLHGEAWREAAQGASAGGGGNGGGPSSGVMSREEALEILGLEPGAEADDVRQAYRRLMQKLHPDHGGSTYLATKLNEAKRVLIGD